VEPDLAGIAVEAWGQAIGKWNEPNSGGALTNALFLEEQNRSAA
jgi:hypothetical protein